MIRLPADAAQSDILATLQAQGCVILEGASAAETLDEVTAQLTAELDETPHGDGNFFGYRTVRCGGALAHSPASQAWALDPRVLAVMDHFLLPHCSHYQLNLSQAIRIEPGEREQMLHADDGMFPIAAKTDHEFMINALWAVSDFTAANGATRLVPGSHRGGPYGGYDTQETQAVVGEPVGPEITADMPRGSVLLYFGSVQHGGGPNRTEAARTGLVFSYCLGWLRQSENQYLTYPPEVARRFPTALQRLIGYRVHEPNLGWVKGQDPLDLLTGTMAHRPPTRDFIGSYYEGVVREYYEGSA